MVSRNVADTPNLCKGILSIEFVNQCFAIDGIDDDVWDLIDDGEVSDQENKELIMETANDKIFWSSFIEIKII